MPAKLPPSWYLAMSKAARDHQHALNMVDKWSAKAEDAQAEIARLSATAAEAEQAQDHETVTA